MPEPTPRHFIQAGKLPPARIITHTIPLSDGPKGYAIFDKKEDRAITVMLKPGSGAASEFHRGELGRVHVGERQPRLEHAELQ